MSSININRVLPHLIAVAVFLVVTVAYYSPIFFDGLQIRQNDILQGQGAGQEIVEFREETGEEALWTNSMFGGMPAYLINTQWSGDLTKYVYKVSTLGLPAPARHTFLAMICFYVMMLVFGVRPYLAIAGGLAYALNSFNIVSIEAGHGWKVVAMAYMPLVLAGVQLVLKNKVMWGVLLTALALALEIGANHLQVTYYLAITFFIYGISLVVFAIKDKQLPQLLPKVGWLVVAAVLAVGANLGKLWSSYEYGKYSIRGKSELTGAGKGGSGLDRDYAFTWSSGKMESLTFLVPNYCGGGSGIYTGTDSELREELRRSNVPFNQINQYERAFLGYWGDQPGTAGPIYLGAIICFLFVLGIVVLDKRITYWLIAATVLSIMLSWGKNFDSFNYFMFDYFPGLNKFRSVTMSVAIAMMAMPLIGLLGLEKVLKEGWNEKVKKGMIIAVSATAGLCILIAFLSSAPRVDNPQLPADIIDAISADREGIISKDAWRSFFFIAAIAALIFFHLKKKVSMQVAVAGVSLLIVLDLWFVDKRYLNDENFGEKPQRQFFAGTEADQAILADTSPGYRVLNLQNPWQDARTSYHHSSIGGYHGAKVRRYNDLIDQYLSNETTNVIQNLQAGSRDFTDSPLLNALNTKYFLAGSNRQSVFVNGNTFGNAWFAKETKTVNSADEEIAALASANIAETAIVDQSKFNLPAKTYNTTGSISLASYAPNHLVYNYSSTGESLVIFSEIYYPKGWVAKIDGNEVPYFRANYIFRAMEVPAGEHTLEFEFRPAAYYVGNKIMLVCSILILLGFVAAAYQTYKNKAVEEVEAS